MSLTLVQVVRIPAEGIEAFQRFESYELPLMPKYGGVLERRLRGNDGQMEVHVISFPSREALQRYMDDPEWAQYVPLKDQSGAMSELIEMTDVAGD